MSTHSIDINAVSLDTNGEDSWLGGAMRQFIELPGLLCAAHMASVFHLLHGQGTLIAASSSAADDSKFLSQLLMNVASALDAAGYPAEVSRANV